MVLSSDSFRLYVLHFQILIKNFTACMSLGRRVIKSPSHLSFLMSYDNILALMVSLDHRFFFFFWANEFAITVEYFDFEFVAHNLKFNLI